MGKSKLGHRCKKVLEPTEHEYLIFDVESFSGSSGVGCGMVFTSCCHAFLSVGDTTLAYFFSSLAW